MIHTTTVTHVTCTFTTWYITWIMSHTLWQKRVEVTEGVGCLVSKFESRDLPASIFFLISAFLLSSLSRVFSIPSMVVFKPTDLLFNSVFVFDNFFLMTWNCFIVSSGIVTWSRCRCDCEHKLHIDSLHVSHQIVFARAPCFSLCLVQSDSTLSGSRLYLKSLYYIQ